MTDPEEAPDRAPQADFEAPLRARIQALGSSAELKDFISLEEDPEGVMRPHKARLAAVIGAVTLGIAITGWLPGKLLAHPGLYRLEIEALREVVRATRAAVSVGRLTASS